MLEELLRKVICTRWIAKLLPPRYSSFPMDELVCSILEQPSRATKSETIIYMYSRQFRQPMLLRRVKSVFTVATQSLWRPLEIQRRTLTVFSGIQPSGEMHMGNYFGVCKFFLDRQNGQSPNGSLIEKMLFSIVDLHSMTNPTCHDIHSATLKMAAILMAIGIDTSKTTLFRQSDVQEHTSLMWLLFRRISLCRLQRMIQWKVWKLYQAAYTCRTDVVPVGSDQKQHIELAIEIAQKINNDHRTDIFTIPRIHIEATRIKSLCDPSKKMSKSDTKNDSCVFLCDEPETIKRKIARATTDSLDGITYDEIARPGLASLISLFALIQRTTPDDITRQYSQTTKFQVLKADLADCLVEFLRPVREEYKRYLNDLGYVESVLQRGAQTAQSIAQKNFEQMRRELT